MILMCSRSHRFDTDADIRVRYLEEGQVALEAARQILRDVSRSVDDDAAWYTLLHARQHLAELLGDNGHEDEDGDEEENEDEDDE